MKIYVIAAAAVAAVTLLGVSHYKAYRHGVTVEQTRQLQSTVQAYRDRDGVENEVKNLGDYDLCLGISRVRDDCEPLRGLEKAAEGK